LDPEDDPSSIDRCNAPGAADPVITPHPLYLDLADAEEARRYRYRGRFADAIPQDMPTALHDVTKGGFVLGSRRFQPRSGS
jgi:putative transposase